MCGDSLAGQTLSGLPSTRVVAYRCNERYAGAESCRGDCLVQAFASACVNELAAAGGMARRREARNAHRVIGVDTTHHDDVIASMIAGHVRCGHARAVPIV